jgi:hypothetical protein
VAVFLGLFIDLVAAGAPAVFWVYLIINTLFLVPAAYFFWKNEQAAKESLGNANYVNAKKEA